MLAKYATGMSGIGLVDYGVWRVYAPAGYIVAGLLLIAAALLIDKLSERR